jgi:hypothetical protein
VGALDKLACLPETTFIFFIGWYREAYDVLWLCVGVRTPDPFFLVHIMTWLLQVELIELNRNKLDWMLSCSIVGIWAGLLV